MIRTDRIRGKGHPPFRTGNFPFRSGGCHFPCILSVQTTHGRPGVLGPGPARRVGHITMVILTSVRKVGTPSRNPHVSWLRTHVFLQGLGGKWQFRPRAKREGSLSMVFIGPKHPKPSRGQSRAGFWKSRNANMSFGPIEYRENDTLRFGQELFGEKTEVLTSHVLSRSKRHISIS